MRVSVRVKPHSTKGPLVEEAPEGLVVYVREPAVDGRANKATIEAVARHYNVAKSSVTVVRGATSHNKIIEIALRTPLL